MNHMNTSTAPSEIDAGLLELENLVKAGAPANELFQLAHALRWTLLVTDEPAAARIVRKVEWLCAAEQAEARTHRRNWRQEVLTHLAHLGLMQQLAEPPGCNAPFEVSPGASP